MKSYCHQSVVPLVLDKIMASNETKNETKNETIDIKLCIN